jgi:hypothetical protein
MAGEVIRNIYIETELGAYRNFYSDEWCHRIDALASTAPKLSEILIDVMLEWRAAAYAAAIPALLPDQVKGYHDSFVNTGEVNTMLLEVVQGVTAKLAPRVPDITSDHELRRRFQTEVVKLAAEVAEARAKVKLDFPLERVWTEYLDEPSYQLGLWGSQQIAFVSIYNSYDNFIGQFVRIALSLDDCRTSTREFKKQLREAVGDDLKDKCWTNNALHLVREARHSLSHAGGRVTKELSDIKPTHGFVVVGGRIQVSPEKTKALYVLLTECVYALAEKGATMSVFK